jgi:hypothetical protein
MISRGVTVDLLLTMSERLRLLPKYRELDRVALYEMCKPVLKEWARRIEALELSVSLGAISQNALTCYSLPDNQFELAEIGDRLIDSAVQIESFICAERMTRLLKTTSLLELENLAKSGNEVPWTKAVMQITGLKNATEAGNKLKQFFQHLLVWDNPEEGFAYRKLLTDGVNGIAPAIPHQLVARLKERFQRDKKLLRSTGRK